MKSKVLVWFLLGSLFLPAFSFSQVKFPSKTYWCVKIEDIIVRPENFTTADNIAVGVRIKLWTQTYITGAPGQKLCNCAIEPSRIATDYYGTTMSLRLIGLKYSETETNLLEYYGPTPSFIPYTYGGFQVIGVFVDQNDVKKGYKEIWGWAPKKNPLKDNREFIIYVTLDAKGYPLKSNDDPDYLKKGCFPPHDGAGDFRKIFKPIELKVPKIDEEIIKKGVRVPALPDLGIAGLETYWKISKRENEQAIIYDEFTMKITVKNSGNVDISKFKILVERKAECEIQYRLEKNSGWAYGENRGTIMDGIIQVENLKVGETKNIFIFADNSLAPKADCWFRITLDPNNEITETNEDNNVVSEIFFPNHYKHPEKYKK